MNLGGLFVLEPFISPAVFQDNPTAVDEWTLSESLAAKGKLQELKGEGQQLKGDAKDGIKKVVDRA